MIPKANRFHGHNAVTRVKARPRHGKYVSVRVAARTNDAPARLAVVVSKKIDNRAVVRNKIRRRIFEAVRTQGLIDGRSIDVVVYAKTAALAEISADVLQAELTDLLTS